MTRWAIFISLPLFLGTLAFWSAERPRSDATAEACAANLGKLHLALEAYLADHGEVLPNAAHWTDELLPYLGTPAALTCPTAVAQGCSYAFNAVLSGLPADSITDPGVVVVFESDAGWDASGGAGLLPARPRHSGRDSYLLLDGSVIVTARGSTRASIWTPQRGKSERPGRRGGRT